MTRIARAIALLLLIASNLAAGSQVVAKSAALSTISPYATQVGLSVLKRGGNAIDAAVAVSFALAVAHPQAGNIGGGGFLVYYDAKEKTVWTLDYREVAPLAATRDMYLEKDGSANKASQIGPMAGGVPGAVAGISTMHARFGTRPWPELIAPAIRLAREGVRVDSAMTVDLSEEQRTRHIDDFPSTALVFYPNGKPLAPGSTLVQADLAETLERIAINGPREFYEGATAKKIVEAMQATGGVIGYRDLREYKPVWRAPIRIRYRDYDIYTMAPPSAGGLILGETLGILSGFDLASYGFQTPRSIHLLAEAERRAYLDRNKYLGDPASVRIPYRELMSDERAKAWRASIELDKASTTLGLTEPAHSEPSHTTHFSIVDSAGNIASITTTINDNFGSGFIVGGAGFFLNNEMDDFTIAPGKPNMYGLVQGSANAIEPGKKMASSMTPTIVLRNGSPYLVLGTRGGATIPTSVLQVFLNITVWKKSLYDAIAAPRYHEQALPEDIQYERGKAPRELLDKLNAMGHGVRERDPIGDIHGILIEKGTITAVADPRNGGSAGGY
jgi:gamma-glutamyltranspeptidase/glutathione hydrolase